MPATGLQWPILTELGHDRSGGRKRGYDYLLAVQKGGGVRSDLIIRIVVRALMNLASDLGYHGDITS